VSLLEPATRDRLAHLQQYFMSHGFPDPAGALRRAVIAVGQTIRAEATIMGRQDASSRGAYTYFHHPYNSQIFAGQSICHPRPQRARQVFVGASC